MNLRKIAALAGTSHTTVSRVLNNSPLVAEQTRERILRIARDLDYEIDAGARSLSTGLRGTVGILYSYHRVRRLRSFYTDQLLHTIREALSVRGFDTLISGFTRDDGETDLVTRLIQQKKVDALLIISYDVTEVMVHRIASATHKCVLVNPEHEDWTENLPTVLVDHAHGGALAAQALIEAERHRLGTVGDDGSQFRTRLSGFCEYLESHGKAECTPDDHFIIPDLWYDTTYRVTVDRLAEIRKYDGLFAGTDVCAAAVMNALQDNGIRVPEDIAVLGYDDVEWGRFCRPPLSTIHQPVSEVAEAAVEEVINRIGNDTHDHFCRVFAPTLIRRASC